MHRSSSISAQLIALALFIGLCAIATGQDAASPPTIGEKTRFVYIKASDAKAEEEATALAEATAEAEAKSDAATNAADDEEAPVVVQSVPGRPRETETVIDEEKVVRRSYSGAEYEKYKRQQIEERWIPIYTDFLNGDFSAHEEDEGITAEKAQEMVAMGSGELENFRQAPGYIEYTANQMAEWAFYYEQLAYWNRYVEDKVLHTTLEDDEKVTYDPSVSRADSKAVFVKLQNRAKEVEKKQKADYEEMVAAIQETDKQQLLFNAWIERDRLALERFTKQWARRSDGTEFQIGKTLYIVRNTAERPDRPAADELRQTLPNSSVLLEVPMERMVTPVDLINADGTLKNDG